MEVDMQQSARTRYQVLPEKSSTPVTTLGLVLFLTVILLGFVLPLLFSDAANGVTANPDPIEMLQQDGTTIQLYLRGDEYFHWNEDQTGFPVVKSVDGEWWVYASEENGRLVPTSYVAGRVDPVSVGLTKPDMSRLRIMREPQRAPQSQSQTDGPLQAPKFGIMKNLVVLVDFTDLTISYTTADYDSLFNEVGYNTDGAVGSVKDYYDEVSYNQLDIQSVVEAPVTISHGYAYYGGNDAYGNDLRPREMVSEALAALEARGFDFQTVDYNNDDWVDGLTIIHAGGGEEYSGNDPDYIWSHQWALSSIVTYDGVRMRYYHTEPARRGWDGYPTTWGVTRIGVICHENGHFLDLPDLYDYGYDSRGAGDFCIMAGGSWNGDQGASPAHMSAWCKVDLGWLTPTLVATNGSYVISQVETNAQAYKLQGSFPSNEYFLVENRQGAGFDAELPGSDRGILIWHIDEDQPNNNDQTHYKVDLEEASGTQHLELNENGGDDLDYFRTGNATNLSSSTTPNNLSYLGNPLGLDVVDVSATGSFMSFTIGGILVTVTAPDGGEVWNVGEEYAITWTTEGDTPDSASIYLSLDSGENYTDAIVTGLVGVSSYDWTVPDSPVTTARVKVEVYYGGSVGGSDASDEDFTIKGRYRYVSPTGGDIYPYSKPEWAAHVIQDAVDAAFSSDTILVAESTYNEMLTIDKNVHLIGGWNSTFATWDPKTYVTTLQSSGSVVSFMNVGSGVLGIEGFTINGGTGRSAALPTSGLFGGGIFSYLSSPIIKGNVITNCGIATASMFSGGGAISCYGGTVTISGNTISNSLAQSGGGIYLYQSNATLGGNEISGSTPNADYTGTKAGGGVYALESTVSLSGNVITENDGYVFGGGVYLDESPTTMDDDSVLFNDADQSGGGIYALHSSLTLEHGIVLNNTAAVYGGGIYHRAENIDMTNSIVALNSSDIVGGGIFSDSTSGTITNNTIDRNVGLGGGNVYLTNGNSLDIRNNLFTYAQGTGLTATSLDNVSFQYNNLYGNVPQDVEVVTVDPTNTSRNPYYADTTSLDYYLLVHSGGIDTGDPAGVNDPDGSRADQGVFGGPDADMAAPEYVKNLAVSVADDTTLALTWDAMPPGGLSYCAIYGDTVEDFVPDEAVFIGTVPVTQNTFQHHPVEDCWYYRVSVVNLEGYGGGYSNQDSACAPGIDLTPPTVTVVYPNDGEIFEPGDTVEIQWIATDNDQVDSVSIYYSENGGSDYTKIAVGEPNDSLYEWIAPSIESDSCLVRVVAYDPVLLTGEDTSDSLFSIKIITGDGDDIPKLVFRLLQNYPNPFNPITRIRFSIGEASNVTLKVYDVSGRVIRVLVDEQLKADTYEVIWDGRDNRGKTVTSGIYFYRLSAGRFTKTRKMVLLR